MHVDMTRNHRLALLADALRIARARGRRDYAIGFAGVAADWIERHAATVDEVCAANLLRIAVEPPD